MEHIIDKAIKSNFGAGEPDVWKYQIKVIMMHTYGNQQDEFQRCFGNHLDMVKTNSWYRIKYGLVSNYMRLYA